MELHGAWIYEDEITGKKFRRHFWQFWRRKRLQVWVDPVMTSEGGGGFTIVWNSSGIFEIET